MRRWLATAVIVLAPAAVGCGDRSLQQVDGGAVGTRGSAGTGVVSVPSGGSRGQGGGAGMIPNCGAADRTITRLPPEVLIVIDASSSMNQDLANMSCASGDCGATSKWAQLMPALNDVVVTTQAKIHWGLQLFANPGMCAVGGFPDVATGPGNAARIAEAIARRTSISGGLAGGGNTPTRAALDAATVYLSGVDRLNPKYVLLATDGTPDCPASGSDDDDDTNGALLAAARAASAGIPVFVVGMATEGVVTNGVEVGAALTQIALAGGRPPAGNPPYYPVATAVDLSSALTSVAALADNCTFDVGPAPTNYNTSLSFIDVFVDGRKVPRDPTRLNGWDHEDGTDQRVITIHGAPCRPILEGSAREVTVTFRCIWI